MSLNVYTHNKFVYLTGQCSKMLSRLRPATNAVKTLTKNSLQRCLILQATQSANQTSKRAATVGPAKIGEKSEIVFKKEKTYGAENYAPIPVAISKGEGMLGLGMVSFVFAVPV